MYVVTSLPGVPMNAENTPPTEGGTPPPEENRAAPRTANGLPVWLTIVVVLVLLALLTYNIIIVGPDGLGTTYVLGGLLGAYAGIDQLLKRRDGGGNGSNGSGE